MEGAGELTWNEAMDRGRAALIDAQRAYQSLLKGLDLLDGVDG